jgi:hypothetical protein
MRLAIIVPALPAPKINNFFIFLLLTCCCKCPSIEGGYLKSIYLRFEIATCGGFEPQKPLSTGKGRFKRPFWTAPIPKLW